MSGNQLMYRWRHPAFLIFILGGFVGVGINAGITLFLVFEFSVNPFLAFGIGTFANQLFHYFYYAVVYVNQEIQMRTTPAVRIFMAVWISIGSSAMLWIFIDKLGLSLFMGLFLCLAVLSISNSLLNRISTFSSAKMAAVEYREMNESYYDDQTDEKKVSKFRAWYHRSRYERLTRFVSSHFKKGMKMADLGCGNCWWNIHHLPVFGVDINAKMLRWAKKNKNLKDFKVCADLSKTGLKSKTLDVVLMSEVMEHVFNLKEVLEEVRRILKDDGTFLITVPYDFFMGPFFILFNLNCLYMGYVRGSLYHKYRCGHIHHFSKTRLRETLKNNGFELKDVFVVNGLLLYATARKFS